MDAAQILAEARARPAVSGVRIIGIDGPAGAGKSTLARAISDLSGAPVIEIDDFLTWTSLESWWPRFVAEILDPLARGVDLEYRARDWWGDRDGDSLLPETKHVAWSPIVIIEGVSVTRAVAADRYALRVWVEAPADERLRRGIARDGEDQRAQWLAWQELEDEFFRSDGTRARADIHLSTA